MKAIHRLFSMFVFGVLILNLMGAPFSAQALSTTFSNAIAGSIADNNCAAPLTRTFVVGSSLIIADVNVGLNITHTRRSDVRVTLTSPSGTTVVLIPGSGFGSPTVASPDDFDNYDLLLDDTSPNSIYDNDNDSIAAPIFELDRIAKPHELLSAFKGEDALGTWTLSVCDTRSGNALGTYNQSKLVFTSADPNTVTGKVFTDYNDNGTRGSGDLPVGNVLVTAYDAAGAVVDTDTTDASGNYSLSIPNGTAVRIEFTNIPAGLEPGAYGVDSGTTVQFVISPAAGVDLGLSIPTDYCQNNPFILMPCYKNGDPLVAGTVAGETALVSIPYDAYGRYDVTIEQPLASYAQIGATWGLGYQRSTATVFSSALAKRHSGLGPLGAGGIYAIEVDPATGSLVSVSNYLDITTLGIPVGTLPSNAARGLSGTSTAPNTDPAGWDAVGKSAIGDMEVGSSDDELWFVNLANQTLYAVDIASATLTHTVPISLPAGATSCPASDIRPWAVEIHRGDVYVGVVCSAESTQDVDDLYAYIIRTSETTPSTFSLVYEFPLDYPRGNVSNPDGGYPAEWRPWSPTMTSLCTNPCAGSADLAFDKQIIYPQPIFSDIEFDTNGSIIIALMDRLGHQAGNANYATSNPWGNNVTLYNKDTGYSAVTVNIPTNPASLYEGVAASDMLRICLTAGVYTLENNASCGGITTGGAGGGQGPGNGEYYWQDMYTVSTTVGGGTHHEVTVGGLVLIPGTDEIAVSVFDPFAIRSGGIAWFSNVNGTRNRAYEIFPQDFGGGPTTFGKAIGIGDVEGFCYEAPIELGNRVWSETDNNGIQDPGETPLAGVTVELYQGGILIATAITDANGNYFFSSSPAGTSTTNHIYGITALQPNSNYEIRIPNITGGSQQAPLAGLNLSPANQGSADQRDSDGTPSGNHAVIPVTTGTAGQNNHTYDFGFSTPPLTYSLGNRVWFDTNNNGVIDFGTEVGIDGVRVELYQDNGDGVFGAGDTFLEFDTTASGGYYRFDNLPPGNYIVVLPADNFRNTGAGDTVPGDPLAGYWSSQTSISSTGVISDATANDPDIDVDDSDDNGISNLTSNILNYVASNAVTLGPGSTEPTGETDLSPSGQGNVDNRANMTVDFGFYKAEIGDLIFVDNDNSGAFNAGDTPFAGALVQIYASNSDGSSVVEIITGADGIPGTADDGWGPDGISGTADDGTGGIITDGTGLYLFSGLPQGDYVIRVTPPSQYTSTVDTADNADTLNPDVNTDNNDNGIGTNGGQVTSGVLTLTPGESGANITVNNANGTTSDPSVDFGFVLGYSLGNRVWYDTNNNSAIDSGEQGISGVRVELYIDNGNGVFDAGDTFLAFDTTDSNGHYRFDGLPAGNYVVVIAADNFRNTGGGDNVPADPLSGYWSSGTSIAANGSISDSTANDPDNDVDSDDNGMTTFTGNTINYVAAAAVTLGPGNSEPTGETDLETSGQGTDDTRANMTVDFGFYQVGFGNLIYTDVNTNGFYNAGTDAPLFNALVQLYAENGTTEIITGADGIPGTEDDSWGPDGISGTADDGTGGMYSDVNGNYGFNGLPEGNYIVRVTPPNGLISSTIDTAGTNDPDSNVDNDDNGIGTSTGTVSSGILTMEAGEVAANITVNNANGTTTDPTVDFGFITPVYSLGNRVWFDTNNNSQIDFGTEAGVNGVTVQLYAADAGGNPTGAVIATDTTTNGGYYRFDNLPAGDYVVVIPASQFLTGGPLAGYWSSGTTLDATGAINETLAPDPDNNVDSDDNGTRATSGAFNGAVISRAITLDVTPSEPINETDIESPNPPGEAVNNQSNLTVDFGFYRQTLGDIVFIDVNADGTYNAGDTPLSGATVQLFSSNGTEINVGPDGILGTADDAPGGITTGAGGTYLFSGLPAGDYIVRVTPPVGYTSTVDTANNADTTDPDGNIDNNDNGIGTGSGTVSSGIVTLTPGNAGAASNNAITHANGTTANPTVDFGFIANPGLVKTIIDSSEVHTAGNDVTIGEIITYEIVIDLPNGTTFNNTTVTDQMERGLAFVDCLSVFVMGVDQTATVCPPAVSPAVGTSVNPADDGRQVVFTLPTPITAIAPSQQIVIQYRAIVLDVIENQSGLQLNNSVTWAWTGGSFTTSAPDVEIIEPDLEIDKSATPVNNVPLGTPVQFTLFIDHTTPASQTDAFDVIVSDFLPATLEYVQCSVTYTAGLAPDTPAATYCNPGNTTTDLIFEWGVFPLGATSTITFNAILLGTPAVNEASVAWTSLPIDPQLNGLPVQLSAHNVTATERWYDPLDPVNVYGVSDSVIINPPAGITPIVDLPSTIPPTGFTPNRITRVPEQPKEKAYTDTSVWLEIPSLKVSIPVTGVPLIDGDWDVSWLVQQAGWLEGTAFPSWQGNSVLTSHVTLADGTDGPFAQLGKLSWGDKIIVYAYGTKYTYEVRQNRTISPNNTTVFEHEEEAWLTLITCKNYNETTDSYSSRVAVRAVLIKTESVNTYFNSEKLR